MMLNSSNTEKKIAKNTLFLLVRMASLMALNLMAVRFVRHGLGLMDYGVLNAITGVVQLLICLNVVLSVSGQRFLSMAMGAGDEERMRNCFGVSLRLSWMLAGFVFLVMETIGLWFVITQMNYPPERFGAVMVIYQTAIFTFMSMLLQIPYLSAVMAHERMDVFASITIFEGVSKFALALAIGICPWDKLIFYGSGLCLASVFSTILYLLYAKCHFAEVTLQKVTDKSLYCEMFSFTGWSLFGTIAGALMLQGNMLLLNVHVGPMANAGFAVALQVYNAYSTLGNNVILAVKPQLVMNYSKGSFPAVNRLLGLMYIALLGITVLVAVPLIVMMPEILTMWLDDVDSMTVDFCRLLLVAGVILLLGVPITTIIQAVGRVKEYHLLVEFVTVLSLPIAWLLLRCGLSPQCVCWSIIACVLLAHLCRMERFWRFYWRNIK